MFKKINFLFAMTLFWNLNGVFSEYVYAIPSAACTAACDQQWRDCKKSPLDCKQENWSCYTTHPACKK